jgi:hypothetical protein
MRDGACRDQDLVATSCPIRKGILLKASNIGYICIAVHDLSKARGERTIDGAPRTLLGNRYAFMQPLNRMCGALTEILDGGFDPSR